MRFVCGFIGAVCMTLGFHIAVHGRGVTGGIGIAIGAMMFGVLLAEGKIS